MSDPILQSNSLVDENTTGCRLLVFFMKFFSVAVWSWMLGESVYLHRLIVAAFRGGGKTYVYVIIGWGKSFHQAVGTTSITSLVTS